MTSIQPWEEDKREKKANSIACVPDYDLQLKVDQWEGTVLEQSETVVGRTKVPIVSARSVCWYD